MAEVLYGTHDESHSVDMSERVQTLASSVYREFEGMIGTYGDGVIKGLMPHIVSILESLNQAYREKQDHEVEIELLRVENDNLKKQFEKEKQLRKTSEQKYLEGDDLLEEEKKLHRQAVDALETNQRRLEIKAKNLQEQILRNEEKEGEMRAENSKLHSNYNELLKTFTEYRDRYKLQMEKEVASPSRSLMQIPTLKQTANNTIYTETISMKNVNVELQHIKEESDKQGAVVKNGSEVNERTSHDNQNASADSQNVFSENKKNHELEKADDVPESTDKQHVNAEEVISMPKANHHSEIIEDINESKTSKEDVPDAGSTSVQWVAEEVNEWLPDDVQDENVDKCLMGPYGGKVLSLTSMEFDDSTDDNPSLSLPSSSVQLQNMSSIYDELAQQDSKAVVEIDGGINLAGVTAEVEKLIRENTELLETKNALNIVKDDLITKVDELVGELELLRVELSSVQVARDKQMDRISELEEELKQDREELAKAKTAMQNEDDDKKCFTRIDMTRVVMERNQFKEKLMDLQEAVRLAEMIRASKEHRDLVKTVKKKSSFWNFFSGLLSSEDEVEQTSQKPYVPSSTKPPTVI